MKKISYFFFLIIICACTRNASKSETSAAGLHTDTVGGNASADSLKQQIYWSGMVAERIPVLLHYQMIDSLLVGELVYLGNTERKPVKLIGEIEESEEHRILEIDSTGNIIGILSGTPIQDKWLGSWFSPKTRNEYTLDLKRIDTLLALPSQAVSPKDVAGQYYYQYGRKGRKGILKVRRLDDDKLEFSILSLTDEPARNIALVDTDTIISKGTSFTYAVPSTDNCEVKVQFYKDFAHIRYSKGDCSGMFGHNASLEGIFYKTN
ncbi:hypothetical protein [Sphingobacterium sp. MYb382]|uniref:hypothetical protein n=1 Tax=Sphingobacterium sp. MYb382 TaxID=2745278 RepID=UPI0030AE4083